MKKSLSRYIEAAKMLILFSATFHLVVLFLYSVLNLKIETLNYFYMLGFHLIFPNIIHGLYSQIFSVLTIVAIYTVFYFKFTRKKI